MKAITYKKCYSYFCILLFCVLVFLLFRRLSTNHKNRSSYLIKLKEHESVGISIDGNDTRSEYIVHIDEAHKKGLRHRGVWIFVYDNATGCVLFSKRSKKTVTCPSTWMVNGEHSKPGEIYLHTMKRGVNEELGLTNDQLYKYYSLSQGHDLFKIHYVDGRIDYQWTESFLVVVNRSVVHVDSLEHTSFQWIPVKDAESWLKGGGCTVINATVRRDSSEMAFGPDFINFYMIRFINRIVPTLLSSTL